MNITEHATTVDRTDVFRVTDGEVRPVQYSRANRTYRVDRVQVSQRWMDGTWGKASALLAGPVLKKDGSGSMNRSDERFHGGAQMPRWVADLVASVTQTEAPA